MTLKPLSLAELSAQLAQASAQGLGITACDLTAIHRIVNYTPEDLTVTVEAGATLADLQGRLRERGQWLPIDPPGPERLTIGALIAANRSGPRRFGCGTIREHLLGMRVALADGRLVKAGGQVVKNVAGYDLCKLFVGSRGALGVIVEATFKVQPLPEAEQFLETVCGSWDEVACRLEAVNDSPLAPVVVDLHNLRPRTAATGSRHGLAVHFVLGFAGTCEDVDWQASRAREAGVHSPADLEYEPSFWATGSGPQPRAVSVLPSRLVETLGGLGETEFVARAGNGLAYYRGGPEPTKASVPEMLLRRVKDAYDPKHILPELHL